MDKKGKGRPLIARDFEIRKPTSVITLNGFIGIPSLEPILSVVKSGGISTNDNLEVEDSEGSSKLSRDLFEGQQATVRDDPIEFGKQLTAWTRGTGWRAYTDYIGGRIMYDGYSKASIRQIMESQQIADKIRELSLIRLASMDLPAGVDRVQKLADLENQMRDVTYGVAVDMVAKMDSTSFLRFFGASVNNVLARMYHQGIHISLPEYEAFRAVAEIAHKKKQSLLLLPSHKSHIDYLTMSWLCYRLGLSLPHIVAGSNLNMPILGDWLKKCGAFFIRRSFGDDALYPVVVKEYIEQLLEAGMNIECFIEGSRSRTGKLLPPKLGILKYVVEAIENGRAEDVWICPISVQYDKVIETNSYVNELLGNPKEKESLTGLLLNTRVVQLKLGRIDVRFQAPFSLKAYLAEEKAKRKDNPKKRDAKAEQAVLLKSLGYQVLSDINKCSVIMPAALVGCILLTIRGRGVGRAELIDRVGWLKSAIEVRGGRVAEFAGMNIEEVVDRAIIVLKDLIQEHSGIEPTFSPIQRFELSFYRNQIMHLFVSEALLSATLYTKVKVGGISPSQRMTMSEVIRDVSFISKLLKNEFVYGTEGLEANIDSTISSLQQDGVILLEDGYVGLSPAERARGRNNFDFYNFLIWPFIEVYWLAAVSLFALTPIGPPPNPELSVAWVEEKSFQKAAQALGKTLFQQGDVSYLEAVNQATLSNAFQRMVELGVILTKKSDTKGLPLMALHPNWVPNRLPSGEIEPAGELWNFLGRLGSFRREGKNRRDIQTVPTRVFVNCGKIAPPILSWSKMVTKPVVSDFWAAKPSL